MRNPVPPRVVHAHGPAKGPFGGHRTAQWVHVYPVPQAWQSSTCAAAAWRIIETLQTRIAIDGLN
ncbi:hypothetical protein AcdelDRAFT_1690 [Acidovorax delafieldii 2AN]|uniref:Uncharacterized protein n=1 Tax=Acidovorax delafieldii 2AN TaxID=573060 RepID=C5T460_ACIDE|nr:hypothetical protein AcdelDRAFT_1690 [Acidovorax delafieldii 2AN]